MGFPGRTPKPTPPPPEPEPKEEVGPRLNKEEQWRYDRLLTAGYTESQSLWLALDRAVDLHKALALRAKTELAFQILS